VQPKDNTKIGDLIPIQYEAPRCFGCGPESPTGIKLRFKLDSNDAVSTTFTPPTDWTGWGDIMHGGFQSLLLDETMAWAAYGALGVKAFVTRDLQVQFIRPVLVGQPLTVFGKVVGDDGKIIETSGMIRDADGTLLASATATMARVDPERLAPSK
jgi:uncharacterized protein (TIGR00369 family)